MSFLQGGAARACAWGAALALCTSLPAAAAEAPARARCVENALEQWYCPSDPRGTAVLDNLGTAACAPGVCVEWEGEWHCSPKSGGSAELTPEGPVCEGGCRAPRGADCEIP